MRTPIHFLYDIKLLLNSDVTDHVYKRKLNQIPVKILRYLFHPDSVLMGMLGMGVRRSYEKTKSVAREKLKKA
jgi:hypothetical protein